MRLEMMHNVWKRQCIKCSRNEMTSLLEGLVEHVWALQVGMMVN